MKKVALVFVLAVLAPSLVLAWLAVRSLRDQQFILERQQSLLYQGVADAKANEVQDALAECQHGFASQVTKLLRQHPSKGFATGFDELLRKDWPLAQVGFAVNLAGDIMAPTISGGANARKFLDDNGLFLANRESANVYANYTQVLNFGNNAMVQTTGQPELQNLTKQAGGNAYQQSSVVPQQQALDNQRTVQTEQVPQQFSRVLAASAEFRQVIGEESEGSLARFVDN
jgi:hypothetical protein